MALQKDVVYRYLSESIVQRYQKNAGRTLGDVYRVDDEFLGVTADFVEFAFTNRVEIVAVLSDPLLAANLVELFLHHSIDFTYENNQFVHFDEHEKNRLQKIYSQYLTDIKTTVETSLTADELETRLSKVIEDHFLDIRKNISRFFDHEMEQRVQENVILKQAVCSEYSPELQLQILGIDATQMLPPVLDIGCGKQGKLVKHLNDRGIQTVGIDRFIEPQPHLIEADWFQVDFSPDTWGVILSHMAFSNHFLFHHRYTHGNPEAYARLYMQILSSLKPGGAFYYAPSLPFIEQFLPGNIYALSRKRIDAPELVRLPYGSPEETGFVSCVTRIG
jgi:SAM-dependent methyltransferase